MALKRVYANKKAGKMQRLCYWSYKQITFSALCDGRNTSQLVFFPIQTRVLK